MRIIVLGFVLASAACAHRDVVWPSAGAGVVIGASAGAAYAADSASGRDVALQVGGSSLAAVLPATLLDSMMFESDDPPSTPGGIYTGLGKGIGRAFLVPVTLLAPSLATWAIGEELGGSSPSSGRAFGVAYLGAVVGASLSSFAVVERMPPWARVVLRAALIGSASTLGYQLGR